MSAVGAVSPILPARVVERLAVMLDHVDVVPLVPGVPDGEIEGEGEPQTKEDGQAKSKSMRLDRDVHGSL